MHFDPSEVWGGAGIGLLCALALPLVKRVLDGVGGLAVFSEV